MSFQGPANSVSLLMKNENRLSSVSISHAQSLSLEQNSRDIGRKDILAENSFFLRYKGVGVTLPNLNIGRVRELRGLWDFVNVSFKNPPHLCNLQQART